MNSTSDLANNRILIVDDNPAIHDDFRKILGCNNQEPHALLADAAEIFGETADHTASTRFEIDSAFQGRQGLEMVERSIAEGRPYALAFVDVRMPPGWDGVETIGQIWKCYPDLQIVICTAYSDHSWEEISAQLGKKESLLILKKPFDNIEVLQLAHALTEKWALGNHLRSHLQDLDRIVAERTQELVNANRKLQAEAVERERAQTELGRADERFAKAFRASPVPIAIQRLEDGCYLDVNDSFLLLTGYRRDELVTDAQATIQLWNPEERRGELLQLLEHHRPVREFEGKLLTKTGERRDVIVSADIFDLGGEACTLMIAEDISTRIAMEQQLRRSQKLEAVGQLAAGLAHDFNNLLTIIQGHSSLQLAKRTLDHDVSQSLEQVSMAADRAATLTRQLLAFGRKQMLQPRPLDLNYILRRLTKMLSRLIGENIDLRCDLADELPALYADEGNIEQIFVNLVINARDAISGSGVITIRTAEAIVNEARASANPEAHDGKFVQLTITDTGCGMDAKTLNRIFEPFFTTKEVGKGTGLGLATVHGIVMQQKGWIEVSSSQNHGTTFQIYLPADEDRVAPDQEDENADASIAGDETILVVEDESAVRGVVLAALQEYGYRVLVASQGEEALDVWADNRGRVQLLLTDVVMPGEINGCDLALRLRKDEPKLKVVISSGYSRDIVNPDLFDPRGIHYVSKPYRAHELVRAVRQCLDAA